LYHVLVPAETRTRATLGKLLGGLIIGVIGLAGAGLFAMQYGQQRAAAALDSVLEAGRLVDLARATQVDFKLQVQEWKNLLLRSRTAADLEQLTAAFSAQEAVVDQKLVTLAAAPGLAAQLRREVEEIRQEHERLRALYHAALAGYVPGDPQTIFAVDAQVRGIDRGLNQRIDTLADAIFQGSRREAEALRERGAREYDTLRTLVSAVAALVIVLAGVLAWLAMRLRQPQPA
jgi:methyl-accepting chemotaxis protein